MNGHYVDKQVTLDNVFVRDQYFGRINIWCKTNFYVSSPHARIELEKKTKCFTEKSENEGKKQLSAGE